MEDDSLLVYFKFLVDLFVALAGGGNGGRDVLEQHLDHLNLLLDASGT